MLRTLRAILQITRFDSSVMGFLSIFIPSYARSNDLAGSVGRSVPLLFVCMCTFIANDLDDLERDEINHPERPLPRRHLTSTVAAVLFFVCLALALFLTRHFVDQRAAFLYYGLVTLSISYGYVVEFLPSLKAPYVAGAITVPLLIVAFAYPLEKRLYIVAVAGFLLALGRELCMDIDDRTGDVKSLLHRIRPMPTAIVAFAAQTAGLALLVVQSRRVVDFIAGLALALIVITAGILWFRLGNHKLSHRIMKLQLLIGMYFLT